MVSHHNFPTFFGTMLGYDCHLFFSLPCALARSSIPGYDLSLFVFFFKLVSGRSSSRNARAVWSTGSPLSSGFALQETFGSPKFPDYPFEYMPRSSTPVVSLILAFSHQALLPSVKMKTSAFPSKSDGFPLRNTSAGPRFYKFRGSITRPALLLPLASDFRYRFYPQSSLLTCWLHFSQVGLSPTG
jgi:hypothetical protein